MPTVKQIIESQSNGTCGTATVRGLSLQIIDEMNLLIPNVLVSFDDLNLQANSPAVNLFMQPAAKEALRRAIRRRAATLNLTSAYRTVAQQHLLRSWFEKGQCSIGAAAKPGLSNHEDGLAIDTPDFNAWRAALEDERWDWLGDTNSKDPFHFTFRSPSVKDDVGDLGVKAFQRLWNKHNPSDQIGVDGRWGPQTADRMNRSPAEGFGSARLLKLTSPLMQGDDVRKVQQALVNAGLLATNEIDGTYGPKTEAAVKKFQEAKGLSVDGIIGPQTRRLLGIVNP